MNDTNSIGGIVKILEIPEQNILANNILVTSFRVQFPQVRDNCIIHLTFWGNLATDVVKYYKVNDYILIEGYLSLKYNTYNSSKQQTEKKIEITVLKIYPFLLNYKRSTITTLNR